MGWALSYTIQLLQMHVYNDWRDTHGPLLPSVAVGDAARPHLSVDRILVFAIYYGGPHLSVDRTGSVRVYFILYTLYPESFRGIARASRAAIWRPTVL